MELFSHLQPTNHAHPLGPENGLLADAFAEFISASARLESSYGTLQLEVAYLTHELSNRNNALNLSLAANERVHRELSQIVDSMPCGVLVVEEDRSVSIVNSEGLRLLDVDHSITRHLDAISRSARIDLAGFLSRNADAEDEREFCRESAIGKRWLSVHDRCLSAGNAAGGRASKRTILILRDISMQKQAEEVRERARRATALAEVASTLAHEIRNPLASLELFAGLIAKGGEDVGVLVSHLHAGIRSLAGTVNNVLSLHGGSFPPLTPLDLEATIRSSVEFARPIADQAAIALLFEGLSSGIQVNGNANSLQQVVLNMVCNAIRHTEAGGTVRVSVQRKQGSDAAAPDHAVLTFIDNGCGISADDLACIFEAGFSGNGNSSGLGLTVCEEIVKQHAGVIRVQSTLGIGTIFHVEIPGL